MGTKVPMVSVHWLESRDRKGQNPKKLGAQE